MSAWVLFFISVLFCFTCLTGCSSVLYQPDTNLYFLPKKFGLQAEEYALSTRDGNTLFAWYFPAMTRNHAPPKGTIVQFHGNAENMSTHFLSLSWIVKEGYSLFIFDYQGYGKSTGSPSQENTVNDSVLALTKALALHRESKGRKFIVYGQSLGGAVAARALADFPNVRNVDLVVLDSTFSSYKSVAVGFLAHHWFTWPLSWMGWIAVSDEYSSEHSLQNCPWPLLVIHDEKDPVVPFENGLKIFEIANCPKKDFWKFNRGRHIGVFAADEPENRKRFLDYLN